MPVRVFESQRAPGGRLATRRFAAASFDHGAQYLTASDAGFRGMLERAAAAGAAAAWRPDWPQRDRGEELWVGAPAMAALPRHLADGLDIDYGVRIQRLERERGGWTLLDDRGAAHADFAAVAIALPAPAAAELAAGRTPLAARVRMVSMAPCWTAMVAFDAPLAASPTRASPVTRCSPGTRATGSKPGREAREAWVLHAAPDWSCVEFDQSPEIVRQALLDRFSQHVGRALPRALVMDSHRWRHARVEAPLGETCLFDADAGLGFCGDWCLEARAEGAWRSGTALGAMVARAREVPASGKIRGSR